MKSLDGNAVTIAEEVEKIADSFKGALEKEGVELVLTSDQRLHIEDAINTLGMTCWWVLYLSLWLFIWSWASGMPC